MDRDELIAAATVLHDEECRSCDRKYRMSCPNMANAILRSGRTARLENEALESEVVRADQDSMTVRWRYSATLRTL